MIKIPNVRLKSDTFEELGKMQALWLLENGKKISMDSLIKILIESQPTVDLKGEVTKPSQQKI